MGKQPNSVVEVTPLELTRSARDISVTERNGFKQCRRQWYLTTIENLEPKGVVNWAWDFGTGIHSGLEAFYKTCADLLPGDPLDQALGAFHNWHLEMQQSIKDAKLGQLESEVLNELLEYRDLGVGMLELYNNFAVQEDDFVVCAVEGEWTQAGLDLIKELRPPYDEDVHPVRTDSGRFLVPIVDPRTGRPLENNPMLSMRLDLIVWRRQTGFKGFWVKDHKTTGSSPSDRGVEMDDQVTGYDYGFWRLTGIVPRGTIFNYLIKQLPKEPRIVSTGLSTAKDQVTLPDMYREAMAERGLIDSKGNITSKKHGECYESLLALGWSRHFKRIETQRNEHELKMFEMRLVHEYADMLDVYSAPDELAYPHLSQYNCPGCPVMSICKAIEDGSDYNFLIENVFQQAKDRKA